MRFKVFFLSIFWVFFLNTILCAQDSLNQVNIRIHSTKKIHSFYIKSKSTIHVFADSEYVSVLDSVLCSFINPNKFKISTLQGTLIVQQAQFKSDSALALCLNEFGKKYRFYDGYIKCSVLIDSLQLINVIPMESYISGVTEAEGGRRCHYEFYKVQSVLARTYLLRHWFKHKRQNFQLCDQEHCQVYHGKPRNGLVNKAVAYTQGQIIVDSSDQLIVAAFHSNSGGQTANSEWVWGGKTSYLKAVSDSFSMHMPNSNWQKKIKKNDWHQYLKSVYGIVFSADIYQIVNNLKMPTRQSDFIVNNTPISSKRIRTDFKLKSAFFSIMPLGNDDLLFYGRGFGHGVGLSQEGAMCMAKQGLNYKTILHHYFQNVKIMPLQHYHITKP